MRIYRDFPLVHKNTLRVDVSASYFAHVSSVDDLRRALYSNEAQKKTLCILGGGANILFRDHVDAFVIQPSIGGITIIEEDDDSVLLEVGAGVNWHSFVRYTVGHGWSGVENMAYIPGTVGAAPVQNIAAYGQNFEDVFEYVYAVDVATCEEKYFSKAQCHLSYRESIFKHELKNKSIITRVGMRLSKTAHLDTSFYETGNTYKVHVSLQDEVSRYAQAPYTVLDVYKAVMRIRRKKLPMPSKIGTAGSFFKNPVVSNEKLEELLLKDPDLQFYPVEGLHYVDVTKATLRNAPYVKLPAGRLLDQLGWKGRRIGNVGTHPTHALCIVNYGASGKNIHNFMKLMEKDVYHNYGIQLEPEVLIV